MIFLIIYFDHLSVSSILTDLTKDILLDPNTLIHGYCWHESPEIAVLCASFSIVDINSFLGNKNLAPDSGRTIGRQLGSPSCPPNTMLVPRLCLDRFKCYVSLKSRNG